MNVSDHMEFKVGGQAFDNLASGSAGSSTSGAAHKNIWRAAPEQLPPVAVCICPSCLSGCVVAGLLFLELPVCPPRLPTTCCSPFRDDAPDSHLKVRKHFMRLKSFLCNTSQAEHVSRDACVHTNAPTCFKQQRPLVSIYLQHHLLS